VMAPVTPVRVMPVPARMMVAHKGDLDGSAADGRWSEAGVNSRARLGRQRGKAEAGGKNATDQKTG